jgi:hypothetical protein
MTTNPLLPWERFGQEAAAAVESEIETATGIDLPQVAFPTTLPAPAPVPTPAPAPAPASLPVSTAQPTATQALPASTPGVDTGSALAAVEAGIKEAIAAAMPAIKAQALNYAKEELQATLSGQTIDQAHPTITVTTSKGKELKIADAKNRSYRAFVQGLGLDCFFAVVALLGTLTTFDPLAKASWFTLAALVLKTLAQTVVTYISRMKITPTTQIDGQTVSLVTVPATSVTTFSTPSQIA